MTVTSVWSSQEPAASLKPPSVPMALPTLESEPFQPFPTLLELAKEELSSVKSPPSSKGLFEELLGSPEVLHQSATERPELYNEATRKLLIELVERRKKLPELSPEEKKLLNEATVEFAQAPRARPAPQRTTATAPVEAVAVARPRMGEDIPVTEMPAFWWL